MNRLSDQQLEQVFQMADVQEKGYITSADLQVKHNILKMLSLSGIKYLVDILIRQFHNCKPRRNYCGSLRTEPERVFRTY